VNRWRPCSRREFVRKLRELGFEGPFSGSRHHFMVIGNHRLAIPSNSEYSVPQLRTLLREAEQILHRRILAREWNSM